MARPKTEIDDCQLRAILRMKPTLADVAAFFACSEDSIERYIKRTYGSGFSEFRDQNLVHTRFNLFRKATEMALAGNVPMLIFCLKNYCGWQDKVQPEEQGERVIRLAYSLDDSTEDAAVRA